MLADRADVALLAVAVLGLLSGLGLMAAGRPDAAALAFGMWSSAARRRSLCLKRWAGLVRCAEKHAQLYMNARLPIGWQPRLRRRTQVARTYYRAALSRARRSGNQYDSGRVRRVIFVLWRWSVQYALLDEELSVALARQESLHTAPAPWWEAA